MRELETGKLDTINARHDKNPIKKDTIATIELKAHLKRAIKIKIPQIEHLQRIPKSILKIKIEPKAKTAIEIIKIPQSLENKAIALLQFLEIESQMVRIPLYRNL
jgi:hypothetical protein